MSAESFSWVYDNIVSSDRYTDAEKLLMLSLADSHSEHNPCLFRPVRIAELIGWDVEKVIRTVEALRRKKIVRLAPSKHEPDEMAFSFGEKP